MGVGPELRHSEIERLDEVPGGVLADIGDEEHGQIGGAVDVGDVGRDIVGSVARERGIGRDVDRAVVSCKKNEPDARLEEERAGLLFF